MTASKFVEALEQAILHIRTTPGAAPRWKHEVGADVRSFPIASFPYVVVYVIEAEELVVLAVAHAQRRPGYWLRRLGRKVRRAPRR